MTQSDKELVEMIAIHDWEDEETCVGVGRDTQRDWDLETVR